MRRFDHFSDIDVQLLVADGESDEVFKAGGGRTGRHLPDRATLRRAGTHLAYLFQRYYRLSETDEYLVVDVVIREESQPERLMEREHHGDPVVLFDKQGSIAAQSLDPEQLARDISSRLEQMPAEFEMFRSLIKKACHRGLPAEARIWYQRFCLDPLIEVLRMQYTPERYEFGGRYLWRDLPDSVAARLSEMFFPQDLQQLLYYQQTATRLVSRDPDPALQTVSGAGSPSGRADPGQPCANDSLIIRSASADSGNSSATLCPAGDINAQVRRMILGSFSAGWVCMNGSK